LKIPDFDGLLVLNPDGVSAREVKSLLNAFADLPSPGGSQSLSELGTAARYTFDRMYLRLCGVREPETVILRIEQALRALAGERSERKLSVADAKISRRKITNVAASIDAYAARLASLLEPHPDPRTFVEEGTTTETVAILGEVEGHLDVGVELFNQGEVLAGGNCVARAGTMVAAQFVRGVLLVQPDLSQVEVPVSASIGKVIDDWTRASRRWQIQFQSHLERTLVGIEDPRTRKSIEQRALKLLHAV
jgi:hypothetical protein